MKTTLFRYVRHQWLNNSSVGPRKLSAFGTSDQSNYSVGHFHGRLKRIIKSAHPNLFIFLWYLQTVTADSQLDIERFESHRRIQATTAKRRHNSRHIHSCTDTLERHECTILQFLFAICHCIDNITHELPEETSDNEEYS